MSKQVVAMSVRVDTANKKYANFAVNAPCSVSTEIANFSCSLLDDFSKQSVITQFINTLCGLGLDNLLTLILRQVALQSGFEQKAIMTRATIAIKFVNSCSVFRVIQNYFSPHSSSESKTQSLKLRNFPH